MIQFLLYSLLERETCNSLGIKDHHVAMDQAQEFLNVMRNLKIFNVDFLQ